MFNLKSKMIRYFPRSQNTAPYDQSLIIIIFALMSIGMVIIASASIPESLALFDSPFHFLIRHGIYISLALVVIAVVVNIELDFWERHQQILLLMAMGVLFSVLIVGTEVNGSHRWLRLGPLNIQPSEFAKLAIILFLASFIARRHVEVMYTKRGFAKPMAVLFIFTMFLMLQPDLGSSIVIVVIMMGMLFVSGANIIYFMMLGGTLGVAIIFLILFSPYRMARVVGFLDPWADPFGKSYQLTQSLMAFGRGGWFGEGLGNSVQKLEYLPEAHTDFIMAILAEELGFVGVTIVILLEFTLVYKAFKIGKKSLDKELVFQGYIAIGIGLWLSFQTAVNIGAASGIAPTKGLTLPLISYGGSSLIATAIAVALLLRIDFETRKAPLPDESSSKTVNKNGKLNGKLKKDK